VAEGTRLLSGPRRNPSAGSNPALSASLSESFSLVQTAALSALPTGCPRSSSSPIASRRALGAKCMYRRGTAQPAVGIESKRQPRTGIALIRELAVATALLEVARAPIQPPPIARARSLAPRRALRLHAPSAPRLDMVRPAQRCPADRTTPVSPRSRRTPTKRKRPPAIA
jgi:hypothetical protein